MITVEKAQRLIRSSIPRPKIERIRIAESLGYVLAEDIRAPFDLPHWDNSAMDGFVLRSSDTDCTPVQPSVQLSVLGIIRAGDIRQKILRAGEAYRIMTGARLPKGGDAILPKEEAMVERNSLRIDRFVSKGSQVRRKGEELRKGQPILCRFSVINPATIGLLAMCGKNRVRVFKKPRVSVIATGQELVEPGHSLKPGQIYDSNSFMVEACLKNMGIPPRRLERSKDNVRSLRQTALDLCSQSDVLILMGGVSVGDYDLVRDVLKECGVRTLFWRVSQKPGKPLYFGKKGRTLIFGLPGNPASVFTCFYEYVFGALRSMAGFRHPQLRQEKTMTETVLASDPRKQIFLKALIEQKNGHRMTRALGHQGSHMISTLHQANCFIRVPPGKGRIHRRTEVTVDVLPYEKGDGSR